MEVNAYVWQKKVCENHKTKKRRLEYNTIHCMYSKTVSNKRITEKKGNG